MESRSLLATAVVLGKMTKSSLVLFQPLRASVLELSWGKDCLTEWRACANGKQ